MVKSNQLYKPVLNTLLLITCNMSTLIQLYTTNIVNMFEGINNVSLMIFIHDFKNYSLANTHCKYVVI